MKSMVIALAVMFVSLSAHAGRFICQEQVEKTVKGFAQVNGYINESVSLAGISGHSFQVWAASAGRGFDTYDVETNGYPECLVLSVSVRGRPTLK